jgi:hypothetical protein
MITVACGASNLGAEVIHVGLIGTHYCDIDKLIRRLQSTAADRLFVYEAGPCGYYLCRYLTGRGLTYQLVNWSFSLYPAFERMFPMYSSLE